MGIVIGALLGFISTELLRLSPSIFLIVIGGIIGFLLQNIYWAREQIDELKKQLESTISRLNNYINPDSSKINKNAAQINQQEKKVEVVSAARTNEQVQTKVETKEIPASNTTEETKTEKQTTAHTNETSSNIPQHSANENLSTATNTPSASEPSAPNPIVQKIVTFFTGDNAVLHAGIVILFLGIAFLLKYAADHSMFPIWVRLAGISVVAVIVLGLGWRLKDKRESYALAMQGAGIGILYLDIFGALKLTDLLPAPVAFFLLIGVCVFSAILAIVQNSKSLATMGAIGGFLAPILASTGGGKYYLLFSYYLLLDSGILALAWYKAWRSLNMVGFIFTFGIGLAWGVRDYQPEMFWIIEIFLLAFFVQFLVISILFAIKQPENNKGYVDGSLVFGSPLLVFGLQTYLLKTLPNPIEFGLAFTALGLAILYIFISLQFAKTKTKHFTLFSEATLALGVMFATLTIPLALNDGLWTSATWALEGCALLWIGIRQNKIAARLFGIGLQFLAGISFLVYAFKINIPFLDIFITHSINSVVETGVALPLINSFYMGSLTIVIAGMLASYLLYKNTDKIHNDESLMSPLLLLWSMGWWFISANAEIDKFALIENYFYYKFSLAILSCTVFYFLGRKLKWIHLQYSSNLVSPIIVIATIGVIIWSSFSIALNSFSVTLYPLDGKGLFIWPLSFALFYLVYYFKDKTSEGLVVNNNHQLAHTFTYLSLLAIIAFEVLRRTHILLSGTDWNMETWMHVTLGATLTLFVSATLLLCKRVSWPFKLYQRSYLLHSARFIAVLLFIWIGVSTFSMTADPTPLPYFPLVNPIELLQAFSFLVLLSLGYRLSQTDLYHLGADLRSKIPVIASVILFLWLNSFIVRTLGHWGGVGFSGTEMLESSLAQATFSIVWSLLALFSMFYATKKHFRGIWFGGSLILGLVVAKLFLVDLKNVETLGRIISFLGVGTLLLLIGYFAPLPPNKDANDTTENEQNLSNTDAANIRETNEI